MTTTSTGSVTPIRARRDEESQHQQALIRWASMARFPGHVAGVLATEFIGDYLYAVPNGGARSKATAGRLKAEGVKAGVWDLKLEVPIGRSPGLWIEMKAGKNSLTDGQKAWKLRMERLGYRCAVCWSWEAARDAIGEYLQGSRKPSILALMDDAGDDGELAHPKDKPIRSPKYLREVATLPCINCGREGFTQAAHANQGKGMAMKTSDNTAAPLCTVGPHGKGCHEKFDQYELGNKHESAEMAKTWATDTYWTLKRAGKVPLSVPPPRF